MAGTDARSTQARIAERIETSRMTMNPGGTLALDLPDSARRLLKGE